MINRFYGNRSPQKVCKAEVSSDSPSLESTQYRITFNNQVTNLTAIAS